MTKQSRNLIIFLSVIALIVGYISLNSKPSSQEESKNIAATSSPLLTSPTPTNPTPSPTPKVIKADVVLYFVAVDDQGRSGKKIGCGDSLVPLHFFVPASDATLKNTLEKLLTIKPEEYVAEGVISSLAKSNLQVDSANIKNGKATVKLTGILTLGGVCDNPRVESQLTETIRQFPDVKDVEIYINNKILKDVLSQKG